MVNSKPPRNPGVLLLLLTVIIVVADVVTKALVRANMTLGQSIPPDGRFRLSYSTNTGSVFGLPLPSTFVMIMTVIMIIVIIWLYLRYPSLKNKPVQVGLGLVLGGAVGNLIDRIRFGRVTDFLDVRIWGDFHWPAFNIADASITIGIFVLICYLLIKAKEAA